MTNNVLTVKVFACCFKGFFKALSSSKIKLIGSKETSSLSLSILFSVERRIAFKISFFFTICSSLYILTVPSVIKNLVSSFKVVTITLDIFKPIIFSHFEKTSLKLEIKALGSVTTPFFIPRESP